MIFRAFIFDAHYCWPILNGLSSVKSNFEQIESSLQSQHKDKNRKRRKGRNKISICQRGDGTLEYVVSWLTVFFSLQLHFKRVCQRYGGYFEDSSVIKGIWIFISKEHCPVDSYEYWIFFYFLGNAYTREWHSPKTLSIIYCKTIPG